MHFTLTEKNEIVEFLLDYARRLKEAETDLRLIHGENAKTAFFLADRLDAKANRVLSVVAIFKQQIQGAV